MCQPIQATMYNASEIRAMYQSIQEENEDASASLTVHQSIQEENEDASTSLTVHQSIQEKNNVSEVKKDVQSHVIAQVPWSDSSYFRCRRCKKWSMLLAGFKKLGSCCTYSQSIIATKVEIENIKRTVNVHKQTRSSKHYFISCSGCYKNKSAISRLPKKVLCKFTDIGSVITHHKKEEEYNIHSEYKCDSCHFHSQTLRGIQKHQKYLQKK